MHIPAGDGDYQHDMQPVIQLYDAGMQFLASQEFAGGDLVFEIDTPGDYLLRVANHGGDTASYQLTLSTTIDATALRRRGPARRRFGRAVDRHRRRQR